MPYSYDRRASSVLRDVEKFVQQQRTWLELEDQGAKTLYYSTRANGDVDAERPGREDLREAKRLADLINREFSELVKASWDYVDEWTGLQVDIIPGRRASVAKA